MKPHPKGHRRAYSPHLRLRALRAGRRIRQPQHQPDGAVSQPGHPRAGAVLAAHVPPLVGHPDDPGRTSPRPRTVLDFPTREAFAAELLAQRIRHRRHLLDHRERRQGAGDVPHGAASSRRARRSSSAATSRRFPASSSMSTPTTSCAATASRGCGGISARIVTAPDPPSGDRLRLRRAHAGPRTCRKPKAHCRDHHSVGGLSDGLQLLHDVGVFRRQGEVPQFLQDRRRTVRRDVADGGDARGAVVLHDGREFPAA